jgi:colanic acid biosynthesis glycosyl transferase WcaI
MRILLLTQFFDPEPTLKGAAFARELRRHGHEVEVLTGFPNYPGGKVYDGYRIRPYTRETVDGVTIHRVALYPSHDRSPVRRVLNYMSFALMATLIGPFVVNRPVAIYVHHPPITITIPAAILSLTTGAPYVLEIQDLWPDTLRATGMFSSSLGGRIVGAWAKRAYALAARIVVISPGFRSALIGRGVPEQKIELVYNWGEEGRIRPEARDHSLMEQYGMLGRFNVLFAGTMPRRILRSNS